MPTVDDAIVLASTIINSNHIKMAASLTRVRQVQRLMPQARLYSSATSPVKRLGVVGAGQMVSSEACESFPKSFKTDTVSQGLGIALVAAQKAQVPVTLVDTSQASIDKGLSFAGASPARFQKKSVVLTRHRQIAGERCFQGTHHQRAGRQGALKFDGNYFHGWTGRG